MNIDFICIKKIIREKKCIFINNNLIYGLSIFVFEYTQKTFRYLFKSTLRNFIRVKHLYFLRSKVLFIYVTKLGLYVYNTRL